MTVPFLFWILHRHLCPAQEHVLEMAERYHHPTQDRRQVDALAPIQFRSSDGDGHVFKSYLCAYEAKQKSLWEIGEQDRHEKNIHERNFEKENPAESHQLIVTKARQRPAHPDKKEKQHGDLREENEDVQEAPTPAAGTIGHPGKMPAAEEESHDNCAAGDHG